MMNTKFKYDTVSEAVNTLRQKGYDRNFHIEGDYIVSGNKRLTAGDLQIAITYRYEGDTDPGDEATVYGIKTNSGEKGILIIADGIYADAATQLLKKLHLAKNEAFQ